MAETTRYQIHLLSKVTELKKKLLILVKKMHLSANITGFSGVGLV
jgi:hypothetical protein